jgi:hypothetical protein
VEITHVISRSAWLSAGVDLARTLEEKMNRDARLMSGILLITVPTIQYGGYFLLRLFSGQMPGMKPSPLQTSFFRAGHAHAGALVLAISVVVLGIGLIRA